VIIEVGGVCGVQLDWHVDEHALVCDEANEDEDVKL